MPAKLRRTMLLIILLILLAGLLPVLLYLVLFSVPSVSALEAWQMLSAPATQAVLVDVRPPEEYAAGHLEGALNWPYEQIQGMSTFAGAPQQLQDRSLLLICDSGISSAAATRRLRRFDVPASNVEGGIQAWVAGATKHDELAASAWRTASGEVTPLPYRESPPFEQGAAVLAYFIIKPLYMLLSLALIVVLVLWGRGSSDLAALRWGLLFFLVGETFCAVNTTQFFLQGENSELYEYLHGLGMALCMGLVAFALIEAMDRRVVKYSDPYKRCALLGLCRACIKHADVPCGLKRSFYLVSPILILLAFIPLVALPSPASYNTTIYNFPYNYAHSGIQQMFETRYCPLLAIGLLGISFLILVFKREDPAPLSKLFLAAGLGPLGFGLLRLVLLAMYRDDQVWFIFWEEVTELIFVVGVGLVLWAFRRGLFRRETEVA